MTKPNYNMYAVVKNNIVIDAAIGDSNSAISLDGKKTYLSNDVSLIEVTEKNSPFYIGMLFKENK